MSAELEARRTAAAAVLADYRAALASVPLGSPSGREWTLKLADALGGLLDGIGQAVAPPSRQEHTVAAPGPSNTDDAITAVKIAARAEHDFAGWLAAVLATVAAALGNSDALTSGRPGSWEASLVDQLVKGTVGYEDEYLSEYRAGEGAQ